MKSIVKGKELEHADCVVNNIQLTISFIDRIKILFGKTVRISMHTYTAQEVTVLDSESSASVDPIVFYTFAPKKLTPEQKMLECSNENTTDVPPRQIKI